MKFVQKENFKPKIKPMIENLQNKLYQLENKQAIGANLCANIRKVLEGEKDSKTFIRVLERQNMIIINQNILWTFLNLRKKIYEKLYTKQTSTAEFLNFLAKFLT